MVPFCSNNEEARIRLAVTVICLFHRRYEILNYKKICSDGINFPNKENFIGEYLFPVECRINSYTAYNFKKYTENCDIMGFY